MTIQLICTLVSLAVLLLVTVVGVFRGMRRGPFHGLIKLGAVVLSVALSTVVCLCLRGVIASTVVSFAQPLIPTEFEWVGDLLELIVQFPASLLLLALFWLIFTVVRLLMLIPEKLICKLLPKTYDDFVQKSQKQDAAPSSAAAEEDKEPDPDPDPDSDAPVPADSEAEKVPFTEPAKSGSSKIPGKLIWRLSAALCGVLTSILMLGAWMMPISGTVTRVGEAVYRVTDTLAQENLVEYSAEISTVTQAVSTAPLFTVTDFFYGNTVYEPLTTFNSEFGRISLSDELDVATDIACQVLPVAFHMTEDGNLSEADSARLTQTAELLTQSDFLMMIGTYAANMMGEQIAQPDEGEEMTRGKQELQSALASILANMTPDDLAADLHTLADLVEVLSDSPLLEALTAENKELTVTDLIDREVMRETFGILYDNGNTRDLITPLINFGTETALNAVGAEPVYSEVDVDTLSREQVLQEADTLCSVAEELVAFSDSLNDENADLASYQLGSAGKALDCFKESALFGDQYEPLVKSLTTVVSKGNEGNEGSDSLVEALGDALTTADSAEALLNSAQSVVVVNKELESGETKGRENENLVSSMDTLLNNTSPDDYDSLKNVAGAHFSTASSTVDPETQAQMTEDFINAMTTVSQQEEKDVAAESDAIQVIYDVTHSGSDGAFSKTSEEEAVNALLDSDIAHEMLTNLNEEGRDYGIRAKLTDENKDKIAAAIDSNDASADRKAALEAFFGLS